MASTITQQLVSPYVQHDPERGSSFDPEDVEEGLKRMGPLVSGATLRRSMTLIRADLKRAEVAARAELPHRVALEKGPVSDQRVATLYQDIFAEYLGVDPFWARQFLEVSERYAATLNSSPSTNGDTLGKDDRQQRVRAFLASERRKK
jgi:hypothetical protein